jgi:hypothetical protein
MWERAGRLHVNYSYMETIRVTYTCLLPIKWSQFSEFQVETNTDDVTFVYNFIIVIQCTKKRLKTNKIN